MLPWKRKISKRRRNNDLNENEKAVNRIKSFYTK
jgi:hypothetical protein